MIIPPTIGAAMRFQTSDPVPGLLISANGNVSYTPPGLVIYGRQNTLFAQPFDANKAPFHWRSVPGCRTSGSHEIWAGIDVFHL